MRIAISSFGRFWTFELAEQVRQRGLLTELYTAYPSFKVDPKIRPFARTFPWVFPWAEMVRRLGIDSVSRAIDWIAIESFDRWVAGQIGPSDIFVHLAHFGLHSGAKARNLGAVVICERGASHIVYQNEILVEEYARLGLPFIPIDPRKIEKELKEYAQADGIMVASTFAARSFIEKGIPSEKVLVLPLGVDLAEFRPMKKQDRRFRVLFVGSYSVRKGIHVLFDALRPLIRKGEVELWFIGNPYPGARQILRRNAGLFVDKGCHPRAQLAWFYSQGSVLVLPSVEDGFGLVMVQAMACGVPVIATTHTGAGDLFTDGKEGFIVPIRDPQTIRQKILWMLDNPLKLKEMSEAALQRVKQMGGWDTYGRQAIEAYSKLFQNRNGTSSGNRV